jgi:hypothetical protein
METCAAKLSRMMATVLEVQPDRLIQYNGLSVAVDA